MHVGEGGDRFRYGIPELDGMQGVPESELVPGIGTGSRNRNWFPESELVPGIPESKGISELDGIPFDSAFTEFAESVPELHSHTVD
jgi:hypothetical protein